MKITKVEVTNFRNLKHEVFELKPNEASIIVGKNGLGKSNLLNAINYVVADCLLTDNYGKGENDIESIVPISHQKGEHTEVSIWLYDDVNNHDGAKFTKIFKTDYQKGTNSKNGHHNEFKINDVKVGSGKEFYETLYNELGYRPYFTKLKCNEVRLNTDPLYPLAKLEYKDLRQLLVAMGCSVTNEELYQSGFEDLRQYESQYLGNWSNMKKACKDKVDTTSAELDQIDNQLKLFNEIEKPNPDTLKALKDKQTTLIADRTTLETATTSEAVKMIETELKDLNSKLAHEIELLNVKRDSDIKSLENEIAQKQAKLSVSRQEHINDLTRVKNDKYAKYSAKNIELANINIKIGNLNNEITRLTTEIELKQKDKTTLETKFVEVGESTFTGKKHTCPYCFSEFDDEEDIAAFQEHRQTEMESLSNDIMDANDKIGSLTKQKEDKVKEKSNNEILAQNLNKEVEELKAEYQKANDELNSFINNNVDLSTPDVEPLKAQIEALKSVTTNEVIDKLNAQIIDVKLKLDEAIASDIKPDNTNQIAAINTELEELDTEIKNYYINEEKYDTKEALFNKGQLTRTRYNDEASLLARVTELIHTMIKLINDKAYKITGIHFVMLEENLTNAGVTETCYATFDGVPFKDLNTSRKILEGVKFIEKIREISTQNNLPILADRLEGIDSVDKIKNLSKYQVICTRVAENESIEIR